MSKRISVCLAVYNEEHNLERCLRAVVDWVHEVVLVDGHSTDKTLRIAKRFGAKVKVFEYPNPPNFLLNRQRALDKATGEWILVLDADEVVSIELKKEIQAVLENPKAKAAYYLPRLNFFLNKPLRKGGVYPDYCLRLFKNGVGKYPLKSLHDQLELTNHKSQIGTLQHDLAHYPYPDFETYLRKWVQYCAHEADLLIAKKTKLSFKLFLTYCILYPKWWFFKTYFRHKGFMDQFPGFIFSLFSALRFIAIYIKLYEKQAR